MVLLDVQLPDINGFEVAARLTENGTAPAIVLTSSRDIEDLGFLAGRERRARLHPQVRALRIRAGGAHRMTGLRRALWALAVAGVLLGLAVLAVVLSSDMMNTRGVWAAGTLLAGWGFIGVGLFASATHASVDVERMNGRLVVRVADDGVGGADPEVGTGLRGLADRLAVIEGRLEIDSEPGRGTTITAKIPCA